MNYKKPQVQTREPETGRYAFDGDGSRMCVCGHVLGLHIAGGFECGTSIETRGCTCERFRLSRRNAFNSIKT